MTRRTEIVVYYAAIGKLAEQNRWIEPHLAVQSI
ncbi:hypothetical protein SAMN05443582_11289 [Phyllobacterium sp. OV277]|jgi:hypothetical protein|nr:hypothetical protein SAMN05443582_11289 [Phyllobacterium sp. OV277]